MSVRTKLSRRTALAGGLLALAASLSACGSDPDVDAADPNPQPISASFFGPPHTDITEVIDAGPDLAVSGQHLNADLLKRFYDRHGFRPVWASHKDAADSLSAAVLRAGNQGLDPDMFHGDLLRQKATLAPLDRELLLSDAFLSYAAALAHGAVPAGRRKDDQTLTPGPIDIAAKLDAAIDSDDPGAAIEALAPTTPTYKALREALQKIRPLATGRNKAAIARMRTIEVNLERQRWLPRHLPEDRVWVNVAAEKLDFYKDGDAVFSTKVIVGQDVEVNQSPEFHTTINASFYNPPWVIPSDIAAKEVLPLLTHDPNYLTKNNMVILANGEVEQLPGPDAGLGLIMFDMPNKFDVYLHDTPDKYFFNRDNRRISHGCIRVQKPRELASLLMQEPIEAINDGIAEGDTTRVKLPKPVPVYVVYQTAFVDTDGKLQFRPDFYHRDAGIWQALHGAPQTQDPTVQAQLRPPSRKLL